MAFVPEKMDENKISFLANEIAKTYMAGKMSSDVEGYIDSYMQVYETAQKKIAEREQKRMSAMNNLSLNEMMDAFDEDIEPQDKLPHRPLSF